LKTYKTGFYGGKFLPFHQGHKYCISVAARQCERLVVVFFFNSEEENKISAAGVLLDESVLGKETRADAIRHECSKYDNVEYAELDCAVMHRNCKANNISEWDAETPYVLDTVGKFDAVYSSEPGYDEYFSRAYPFARHIIIDAPRVHVPISGTRLREMTYDDAEKWL